MSKKQLNKQITILQKHANQQLVRFRKLTWTSEQWEQYEQNFGKQDCKLDDSDIESLKEIFLEEENWSELDPYFKLLIMSTLWNYYLGKDAEGDGLEELCLGDTGDLLKFVDKLCINIIEMQQGTDKNVD